MTQNQEKPEVVPATLCLICKDLYGHPNFDNMCSQCFKQKYRQSRKLKVKQEATVTEKKIESQEVLQKVEAKQSKQQETTLKRARSDDQVKITGKCLCCNKKVGLLGYKCKHCNADLCKMHRLPEDHNCSVDFVKEGRKKLKIENPVVGKAKIQKF